MDDGLLDGVGRTALGIAVVRAVESQRPDRLFDDPWAQAFVDARPDAFAVEEQTVEPEGLHRVGVAFFEHAVIRTRFYDGELLDAVAAGCRQVVVLAAGLDTRAFRLPWPEGVRLFEADLPGVLAFKDEVLAAVGAVPRCERIVVPTDLRDDWTVPLAAAGHRAGEPTAWLVEGLLLYLEPDDTDRLFARVQARSAPGSRLATEDGVASQLVTDAAAVPALAPFVGLWKGAGGEPTADRLHRLGWRTRQVDPVDLAAGYGRDLVGEPAGGFVSAAR